MNGIFHGVPSAEYHAGLGDGPKPLSSTFAKRLLETSPAEARWAADHPTDTAAFTIGRAVHEIVLEKELKTVKVFPYENKRGNLWKEAVAEAAAVGKTAMLEHELTDVYQMRDAIQVHTASAELLNVGAAEVSAVATIDGVPMQARADWLKTETSPPIVIDLKTVAGTANPRQFDRTIAKYGYHLQAAFYQRVFGEVLDVQPRFIWIVVSKAAPHTVSVVEASAHTLDVGHQLVDAAAGIYRRCIESGEWPGYDGITESNLPTYAEYEADDLTEQNGTYR